MGNYFSVGVTFKAHDKSSRIIGKIQSKVMSFTSKAAAGMRRLDRAMSKVSGVVTRGLQWGFASATVAATGLFMAINRTAEHMDALAKKTRAINFPIEEFQEWRFVAEQSGVSSDLFDRSLAKFTKTVGELKGGYGALHSALKKTNPSLARQLKATDDVSQAFDLYLTAIRETPSAMDKAALATAAFGRAGVDMINIANNSAEEISKLRAQMRENGVVTAEQAAKAEAYNDMMNRVKKTIAAFMFDVLTPLMPILTDVMDTSRKWAVANREIVSTKFKSGLKWVIDNFDTIVSYGKKIGIAIGVFYSIAAAIKVASTAMTIFNAVAAMNPIGLIVIATAAAVAAIIVFRKELIQFTVGVMEKIKSIVGSTVEAVKAFFDDPKKYLVRAWDFVLSKILSAWDWTWGKIKHVAKFSLDNLRDYIGIFVDLFTGNWEGAVQRFKRMWDRMKSAAISVLDRIKSFLDPILKGIGVVLDWSHEGERRDAGTVAGRSLGGAAGAVAASVAPSVVRPTVSISKSETRKHEEIEVTIKDETNRARITRGSSRHLKLAHTGGVP